jgi:hypothetical protein
VSRIFRLWEKKRGGRQTTSRWLGTVGEAVFYATIFLFGVGAMAALLTAQFWTPDPDFFRIGIGNWLLFLLYVSMILLGGGSFFFTIAEVGTSAERRSAIAARAGDLDIVQDARSRVREFPTIPVGNNLTNSPGTRFQFRLPNMQSPAWSLIAAATSFLLSSAVVAVLLVVAIRSHGDNAPRWLLNLSLVPLSSVSAWTAYYLIRQMMLHTGIGPTIVEIAEHPLRPGETYKIYLAQLGRLRLKSFAFCLTCEEETTYQQGTDIRTETLRVFNEILLDEHDLKIEPLKPFERELEMKIPDSAMHSFLSPHNAVQWKLIVHGHAESWPPFDRSFPLIVYPPTT